MRVAGHPIHSAKEMELVQVILEELQDSFGEHPHGTWEDIKDQRTLAWNYYYGKPFGNEVKGKSQVISTDVMDTVEWIMPSLMRVFTSTDAFAEFTPNSQDDVEAARQEMDYVNHVFDCDNRGFITLHNLIKDALLLKAGIAKVWWDGSEEKTSESFTGLDEAGLSSLFDTEDEVEVTSNEFDPETGLMDVEITRTKQSGKTSITVIPPEDFIISKRSESLADAPIKGHRYKTSRAALRKMGMKNVDFVSGSNEHEDDPERLARFSVDDSAPTSGDMRRKERERIWVSELYINYDWNEDGVDELLKVTLSENSVLLDMEEVDDDPFISMTPIIIPHKFYGMSVADLVLDIQLIKSTLLRNILDNMYVLNNGRYVMLEGGANLDDLLTSRPGGVIRETVPNAVRRLDTPPLPAGAFDMVDKMDQMLGARTGATKFSQGLDANVLQNVREAAIAQHSAASQSRIEMIARIFAETGVKDLFLKLHALLRKNQRKGRVVKLRQKFVAVNPSEWKERNDVTINVGLGRGSMDTKQQNLGVIAQLMQTLAQQVPGIVTPDKAYNLAVSMVRAMGMKNEDEFFNNPAQQQQSPDKPDPEMLKLQLEQQEMQLESQFRQAELKLKAREVELKELKTIEEIRIEKERLELDKIETAMEFKLESEQGRPVAVGK